MVAGTSPNNPCEPVMTDTTIHAIEDYISDSEADDASGVILCLQERHVHYDARRRFAIHRFGPYLACNSFWSPEVSCSWCLDVLGSYKAALRYYPYRNGLSYFNAWKDYYSTPGNDYY